MIIAINYFVGIVSRHLHKVRKIVIAVGLGDCRTLYSSKSQWRFYCCLCCCSCYFLVLMLLLFSFSNMKKTFLLSIVFTPLTSVLEIVGRWKTSIFIWARHSVKQASLVLLSRNRSYKNCFSKNFSVFRW
jgi:hypothetical protein